MLKDYLTQVVIHKSKIGTNVYLEPVFEEKEIVCRIVEKFKEVEPVEDIEQVTLI